MATITNLFLRINELNLSAKRVSDATGISTGNLSDWKKGRCLPSAEKLEKLADYLDCSVDYLLGRTNNPVVNADLPEPQPVRTVDFFILPASAGTGEFLDNNDIQKIDIPDTPENKKVDCAIRVSGDSMLPLIHDGDIALVSRRFDINDGDIGVFIVDGDGYIKKYRPDCLESVNPEYDNILTAGKSVLLVGKVLSFIQIQR